MESMTIEAIKEAISQLPEDDQLSLATWLNSQHALDDWDKQMMRDFSPTDGSAGSGRGMQFVAEIQRELADSRGTGHPSSFEEGFALRRRR